MKKLIKNLVQAGFTYDKDMDIFKLRMGYQVALSGEQARALKQPYMTVALLIDQAVAKLTEDARERRTDLVALELFGEEE